MKLLIWHHLTEHANDPSELGSGVLLSFLALLVDPFQLSWRNNLKVGVGRSQKGFISRELIVHAFVNPRLDLSLTFLYAIE